jgi:dipeptidyl aminopeptidase/acylaminoacyl peptidase
MDPRPPNRLPLKALICHVGYFSTISGLSTTEEQCFVMNDLGGPLLDLKAREIYDRWDPAWSTENWQTLTLMIHNGKDYRVAGEVQRVAVERG